MAAGHVRAERAPSHVPFPIVPWISSDCVVNLLLQWLPGFGAHFLKLVVLVHHDFLNKNVKLGKLYEKL